MSMVFFLYKKLMIPDQKKYLNQKIYVDIDILFKVRMFLKTEF